MADMWTTVSTKIYNAQGVQVDTIDARARVAAGSKTTLPGKIGDWRPVAPYDPNKQAGFIRAEFLTSEKPQPASFYTTSGKCKPLNHHTLPLMENPDTDSQLANINADEIPGVYMQYDSGARWARGRNWYHLPGLSVSGARYSPAGWLPCWWTQKDNMLEIYPGDGKPHPDCEQEIQNVPEQPPDEPPPPPPPPDVPPGPVDTEGQVANGGFEGGVKPTPPGVSGLLPEGWVLLWYADANTPKIERQDSPWAAPEIMVNSAGQLTDDLKPLPEGDKCLHIFKGWAPTWCQLGRRVHITPGRYQPYAHVFFDPVAEYSPKRYGQDPITSEFRVYIVGLAGPFVNQGEYPPGAWRQVDGLPAVIETEGDYGLVLEFRGRFGMRHNGCFVDNVRLVRVGGDVPPPPPPPPPDGVDVTPELASLEAAAQLVLQNVAIIRGKLNG